MNFNNINNTKITELKIESDDLKKTKKNNNTRVKRNLKVFFNVYYACLNNGKEMEFCLHLANLYYSVIGHYGPIFSQSLKDRVKNHQKNREIKTI